MVFLRALGASDGFQSERLLTRALASRWHDCGMDALDATSCAVLITDATLPDNPIVYANAAFSTLWGYAVSEVVGRNCRFLQGPQTDPQARENIREALAAGRGIRHKILNYRKDGTSFWNDVTIDPIRDPDGRLVGFVGIQAQVDGAQDSTEMEAEAESKLAALADHIPGYIYQRYMRKDGSVGLSYCSPSICKLLEIEYHDVLQRFYHHVHPDDLNHLYAAIHSSADNMSIFREEFRLVSSAGVVHWMRSDAPPRRQANGDIVWDGLAIEISTEKRWESEIARQALQDTLTGLLTRDAWGSALTAQLSSEHDASARCGVLCVDISGFHDLNERFGHRLGDEVLRQTAQRLVKIAASASGVVGRLGGDVFTILAPNCTGEAALSLLAKSTSEELLKPFQIDAHHLTIQTCIGAALHAHCEPGTPVSEDPPGELIMQAELALRWAKAEGGNTRVLYSRERDDRFQNRALLARSLEQAIANDELELHYQPLVELASGRIVSAEALVRWNHPTLGMQRPDLFIPLAETSGLIVPLGRWVLDQALRQRRKWQDAGLAPPSISINVSGNQLLDPTFVAIVRQSLLTSGANPRDFELELTEGLLIEPSPQIMDSLTQLRTMGFTITIDDFGAGHAAFRYLRDFPVDKLKIDQVFVRKLVRESTDALIIRAIISLTRSMGIGCVAEGIETEMQRDFLEHEGCLVGQGYLFSMPLVAEDFGWLLANDVRLPRRASARQATG